jgi:Trypsin
VSCRPSLQPSFSGEFYDQVLVGASRKSTTTGTAAQWRKIVSRMVMHPRYSWGSDNNDFMLFKIEPVTNPGLAPILLNEDPAVPRAGDQFTVVGMGYNSSNYTSPDRLLKVPVRYVEHDLCQGQWDLVDDYYYYNETKAVYEESMFCAIGDVAITKGPTSGTYECALFPTSVAAVGADTSDTQTLTSAPRCQQAILEAQFLMLLRIDWWASFPGAGRIVSPNVLVYCVVLRAYRARRL